MAARAVVLIGVARTGGMPELQAVHSGLRAMRDWAVEQGIPEHLILTFSDRDGTSVTAGAISAGVARVVEEEVSLTQLLVYFAGHGINDGHNEFWMLSDAPADPNAAVNVAATALFAERLPIPHIVIVSDACRTLPQGLLSAGITGSVIVPNVLPTGPASAVDLFYACLLGSPANEIRDKDEAAAVYRSLYTEVLVEALRGDYSGVLDPAAEIIDGTPTTVIRPRPLKRELPDLAVRRLQDLGALLTVNQRPDAKVTSDESAWLSVVAAPATTDVPRRRGRRLRQRSHRGDLATGVAASVAAVSPVEDPSGLRSRGGGPRPLTKPEHRARELSAPFGPRHFETGVGIKVRGAAIVRADAVGGTPELLGTALIRLGPMAAGAVGALATSVVLEFDGGALVLPTFHSYLTSVTVTDGVVADIAWEPVDGTDRGARWQRRRARFQAVRSRLVVAMDLGVDPIDADRLDELATWALDNVDLDPSVAIVTAWPMRDAGRRDLAARLRDRVVEVFGVSTADLELAADVPVPGLAATPGLPLLARSWATFDILADPHPAPALSARRLPSSWSMYHADAFGALLGAAAAHGAEDLRNASRDDL